MEKQIATNGDILRSDIYVKFLFIFGENLLYIETKDIDTIQSQ